MTSFEDHELWYPDAQTNNIYITSSQDLILSYCKVAHTHTHSTHCALWITWCQEWSRAHRQCCIEEALRSEVHDFEWR